MYVTALVMVVGQLQKPVVPNAAIFAALEAVTPFDPFRDVEWTFHVRRTKAGAFVQLFREDGRGKINVSLESTTAKEWRISAVRAVPVLAKVKTKINCTAILVRAYKSWNTGKEGSWEGIRLRSGTEEDGKSIGAYVTKPPYQPWCGFYYTLSLDGKLLSSGGGY